MLGKHFNDTSRNFTKGMQIARDEPHRVDHLLPVRSNPRMTKKAANVLAVSGGSPLILKQWPYVPVLI